METIADILNKNWQPKHDYELIVNIPYVNGGKIDYLLKSFGIYEKEDAEKLFKRFWKNKKTPFYLQKTWDCSHKSFEEIKDMFFLQRKWGNPLKLIKKPEIRKFFSEMEISETTHRE